VADLEAVSSRADDCLLVFIVASLRSLARAVPGDLLRAAIGDERWSIDRAITRVRLIAEPEKRARAMIALLSQSTDRDAFLDETLGAIEKSEIPHRSDLLHALAELLSVLRRLVTWAGRAVTPYKQNQTLPLLHKVLERIPAPLAEEALRIAGTVGLQPMYLYLLLPEPERTARIRKALDESHARHDDLGIALHASVVSALAGHLDPGTAARLTAESLAEVRALAPGYLHYRGLLDLLPVLGHDEQPQVLDDLIERARKEPREFHELAASAPPGHHGRIRKELEALGLPWVATEGLALSGEHRNAVVERALDLIEAQRCLVAVDGRRAAHPGDER
jgi:hypothetical protein